MPTNASSPVNDGVRKFNKHVLNPLMLHLAGRKHWYAGVIRHTGRRTGRTHRTPVVAVRVADHIVTPLPYGADTDWLRNTLEAGEATITTGGERLDVVNPRIIDTADAATLLPARRLREFTRFGIDHFAEFDLATDTPEESGHED
ncbi:nitroreductase [Mycolicibacterium sp. Y3]